ncbi:MAG: hypothetical protein WCO07_02885 [bacterium]
MIKRGLIILSALVFFLGASIVNAQLQGGDIALSINPAYPNANSNVTATVSTYTTDLNSSKISWILDGNLSLEGIGKKTFSFTVGNSNSKTTLEVKIETMSGAVLNKQMVITPTDIDMLYEAYDSYVPAFYKGKKLGAPESNFKVVAIPNTRNLAGFIYNWKLDDTAKQNSSGYGKDFFTFKQSFLDKNNVVDVIVSDLFGKNIGSGTTIIKTNNPKIIFYEKDPALGTKWEKALGNEFRIGQGGIAIVAEPYFFSSKDINSTNLTFNWSINGEQTQTPAQKNLLAIKPEDGKSGNSNIKVVINNIKTLFQSVEGNLNVNF